MNVTFVTGDPELDKAFCKAAPGEGFYNLKGHRLHRPHARYHLQRNAHSRSGKSL